MRNSSVRNGVQILIQNHHRLAQCYWVSAQAGGDTWTLGHMRLRHEPRTRSHHLAHLCLEVDPMLERFLVVQRDPQIVPIIYEVVLGLSGHFPKLCCSPPRDPEERRGGGGRFTGA